MAAEQPPDTEATDGVTRASPAPSRETRDVPVETEMEQAYIDYAMSVIAGRALPAVQDGLKPVQRRILYAMHTDGITSGGAHRKSSNVVGKTMGDFHPHGDSAIYEALARMSQPFSLRECLIDGQGNFGSMDGDRPAAMRYTEARLAPLGEALLDDIEKSTVNFESTYDSRGEEPVLLPSPVPNLLVNGAAGIAVGMSTDIPPHNLGEVIDATLHRLSDPDCDIDALLEHVPGPDFPTGGTIVGRDGIREAYTTGRGKVRVRAAYDIVEGDGSSSDQIIITELPYPDKGRKAARIESIAENVNNGVYEDISDIRDESDSSGTRIAIDLKRDAMPEVVAKQLVEHDLELTQSIAMVALDDGQPRVFTLAGILDAFIDHRKEVVRRRTQHDLDEASARAHVLEGRLTAVENVDAVVDLIRGSEDRTEAQTALEDEFGFSERQSDHIVRMQLGSLTSMEKADIESEYDELQTSIERFETILGADSELRSVVAEELREMRDTFTSDRRTDIIADDGGVTNEDLIPYTESYLVLTNEGYVKRLSTDTVPAQNRGGKGRKGTDLKAGDGVHALEYIHSHDHILWFTDAGQVHKCRGFEIPEHGRTARGRPMIRVLDIDPDATVTAVLPIRKETFEAIDAEANSGPSVTMATVNGRIKRTRVAEFQSVYSGGKRAVRLDEGDSLVDVELTDGTRDVFLTTSAGKAIRFDENEVRQMGRTARGVLGVDLDGASVVSLASVPSSLDGDESLITVTENGYGKRTLVSEYRKQSRNGKGVLDIKTNERNGASVATHAVDDAATAEVVCVTTDGTIMRTPVDSVSTVGRNTMGVRVMQLDDSDTVASTAVYAPLSDSE
jgi:DNA gyrase subunit A